MEKFLKYFWVITWGVFSIIFFVFAMLPLDTKAPNEKVLVYLAMCIACQARCEIKILQNRLEELKDEKGLHSKTINYDG